MSKKIVFNQPCFLGLCGFIALSTITILNIVFGSKVSTSIVPYANLVSPIVNGSCAVLCLFFIFFPRKQVLLLTILTMQSVYDVLTGFEILGLFLFLFINLILFCKGFFCQNFLKKLVIIFSIWILLLTTLLAFGIERFIFTFVITLFMISAFFYIHYLLIHRLSYLFPEVNKDKIKVEAGTILKIKDLDLTERQEKCLLAYQGRFPTYKELAEILLVSESTIKLEMSKIFKKIGVKNREELKMIMSRYEII